MAYNTKEIVKDVDGNPISQYYNSITDQYEPVEGSSGGNKVVVENNDLSLIPILDKLSQLTGTVIDEETRKFNELQRIVFFEMLQQMLEDGELKGERGIQGFTGDGLEFTWRGTELGVRIEGEVEYIYVNLKGEKGDTGDIANLTSTHVTNALGYTPLPVSGGTLENYNEKLTTVGSLVGSINLSLGNVFVHTPSGNITYSITNTVNGQAHSFTLIVNMGSTVRTLTFPTSVKWQDGEIPDLSTASKTYVLTFMTVNGGTTWLGMFGGEF